MGLNVNANVWMVSLAQTVTHVIVYFKRRPSCLCARSMEFAKRNSGSVPVSLSSLGTIASLCNVQSQDHSELNTLVTTVGTATFELVNVCVTRGGVARRAKKALVLVGAVVAGLAMRSPVNASVTSITGVQHVSSSDAMCSTRIALGVESVLPRV